ncbi:MAG: class I SAM-dependent rRNA methyltransferase [Alphaproteobacteria bacterium]|nr:class I SAM-dependent rRNA methyltransferase [Rhodospirillaceae bacterium]MBT7646374.1 class I SAM-dependent rRNA methyltransferase [Rhodospirillaceae bacterium]MDG2479270.1 class I SAM-dependent rRNA methyltransferase [Alphaproteobacteria bacterium]
MNQTYPTIRLKPGAQKRLMHGHPWAFSNEIAMDAAAKALEPGALVSIQTDNGEQLGVAIFNPHSLIAARLMSASPQAVIDRTALRERIAHARNMRDRLYDVPHYRLAHAEADGLPGVAIDRFDDVAVCQVNTAGMERLADDIAAAVMEETGVKNVILRGDSPIRRLEGLDDSSRVVGPGLTGAVDVIENGVVFRADPMSGQKTGWFFDQRDNRAFMAKLADGATVLDVYSHTGGFGLACAAAGAQHVTMVDRSETSLALAAEAASANDLAGRSAFHTADAFDDLAKRRDRAETFDIVISDPPAFVRAKKELGAGVRGYRKLTRLAAKLVAPGGFLAVASCSHHVDREAFQYQIGRGLQDAGRKAAMIRDAGAGPDHPIHPQLPESAYLKFVCLRLDQAG